MKRGFPRSYPYLNEHGLAFTKSTLEMAAGYFLKIKTPKTLDLGLEIAYIMLWTMEKATDHLHFIKLTHSLVLQATKRVTLKMSTRSADDLLLEQILDPGSVDRERRMLDKMDVERLVGSTEEVQDILELRKRDRDLVVAELKKKWEGWK